MPETIKEERPGEQAEPPLENARRSDPAVTRRERGELKAEVVSAYDQPADCAALLYAPIGEKLTWRRTRCYRFVYEGSETRLETFIEETLLDPVSQELILGGKPALDGWLLHLDYGMKKGVLDLEKEAIYRYYRELKHADFAILDLELSTRIYVFGGGGPSAAAADAKDALIRDIVNPAIHRWEVHDG